MKNVLIFANSFQSLNFLIHSNETAINLLFKSHDLISCNGSWTFLKTPNKHINVCSDINVKYCNNISANTPNIYKEEKPEFHATAWNGGKDKHDNDHFPNLIFDLPYKNWCTGVLGLAWATENYQNVLAIGFTNDVFDQVKDLNECEMLYDFKNIRFINVINDLNEYTWF